MHPDHPARTLGDYGGILYTFVGIRAHRAGFFSLEEFYPDPFSGDMLEVFDILLGKFSGQWYGQPRLRDLPCIAFTARIFNYERSNSGRIPLWCIFKGGVR